VNTMEDLDTDRVTRWQPDPRAVAHAQVVLAAEDDPEVLAAIPMYQPGKASGIWEMGQEVVTVQGAVFFGRNRHAHTGVGLPSFSWARGEAVEIAQKALDATGREGTVAYAVVRKESDDTPVFEW
jgi:hypothetical protein